MRVSVEWPLTELSCAGAQAEEAQTGRRGFGNTQVLRHLFQMGHYKWAVHQKPAPATLQSFRYSAVLGQELLAWIEATEDRVTLGAEGQKLRGQIEIFF